MLKKVKSKMYVRYCSFAVLQQINVLSQATGTIRENIYKSNYTKMYSRQIYIMLV